MPLYTISDPETGQTFEVEGDSPPSMEALQEIFAHHGRRRKLAAEMSHPTAKPGLPPVVRDMSGVDRFRAGMGKGFVDLGRGIGQMAGLVSQEEVDEADRIDAPLMESVGANVGRVGSVIAAGVPASAIPGANTAVGASLIGAGIGVTQPVPTGGSRTLNTIAGATGGFVGNRIGSYLTRKAADDIAAAATAKAANQAQDDVTRLAHERGFVLSPAHSNPSVLNRTLEGLAGKLTTAQQAAVTNQQVTNRLARRALGMRDDTPLTSDSLKALRTRAGEAYRDVARVGRVKWDQQYADDLRAASDTYESVARTFPTQRNLAIERLAMDVVRPEFSSKAVVPLIRKLRFDSRRNFGSEDPSRVEFGRFQRGVADALENLVERNVSDPGLVQRYRDARQLIARTHTVEDALDAGGNVAAGKLARALAKGAPLVDELKDIATVATQFPRPMQLMTSSANPLSPWDYAATAVTAAGTGSPLSLGVLAARPTVRAALLSRPFQAAAVQPSYNALGAKATQAVVDNPLARMLLNYGTPAVSSNEARARSR